MTITRFFKAAVIAVGLVAASAVVGGCDHGDDLYNVAYSPLIGIWTLERIDDVTVNGSDRVRYVFREDPADVSSNHGIGLYQTPGAAEGDWQSTDIAWHLEEDSHLVIEGTRGAGTFSFILEPGQSWQKLTLTDEATSRTYLYLK